MSLAIPEDAASVLEQFVHDVANTPAEISHLLEEMQAKDMQIQAFKDEIAKRDAQLQKWVRVNGGHVPNPKEEAFSKTISDCYDKCEILQAEKCGLSEKALIVLERQIKRLDLGLRGLSAREEFPTDWAGPSLLSASGNVTGVSTPVSGGVAVHQPLQAVSGNLGGVGSSMSIANAAQMRMAAQHLGGGRAGSAAGSGVQTPRDMPPRNQREGSSEANKRRRLNPTLSTLPAASSNLRQSSLGPGTPKAATPGPTGGTGPSRASSAQPRPAGGQKKAQQPGVVSGGGRSRLAPPQPSSGRKRDRDRHRNKKGDRRRQLKSNANDRATPSSNASISSDNDADSTASPTPSSLLRSSQADGAGDRRGRRAPRRREADADSEDDDGDDEEGDDDNSLYCFCQRPSFGEMVGCDNDNCQFEWFHYECVSIREKPDGEWLCPDCRKLPRSKIVKETA